MKIGDNSDNSTINALVYHDNNGLAKIKANSEKGQALEQVAGEFEAMFLQMVLRQMRTSSDVLSAEDSPFSSKEQGVFRDLHDAQVAREMATKQNLGIADMLIKQLGDNQAATVIPFSQASKNESVITQPKADLPANDNLTDTAMLYDVQSRFKDVAEKQMMTVAFQYPPKHSESE